MTDDRIPRWIPVVLADDPETRLILPSIDGTTTISELASLIDADPASVARVLEALAALGALAIDEPAPKEELDLPPERQARILELYERLHQLDHYALLGVRATCDDKEVKRAYFGLAKDFHPDRYFRKRLGGYKQKLEAIFTRMTAAHDLLTDQARRADYDGHLIQLLKMRAIRRRATQAEAEGQWEAAAELWRQITEALSDDPDSLHGFARASLRGSVNFAIAMDCLSRAITLDPTRASYRVTLVEALIAEQRDLEALPHLEYVAQLEPDNDAFGMLLAELRARIEDTRRWLSATAPPEALSRK